MNKNFKSILFKFDFLGITPQLKILNNKIYKSIFSSIFSLLIIIISVFFGIYSFINFINQNPMIDYYKSNDFNINKTIAINDSFIMFKILLVDTANMIKTNISFLSYYSNEEDDLVFLKVEKCQLGKNIDFKYQELFKSFEKKENESIGEYFCINVIGRNISLFQNPNDNNMKDNYLRLIIYLNEPDNKIQYFSLKIVTENDIIYHMYYRLQLYI